MNGKRRVLHENLLWKRGSTPVIKKLISRLVSGRLIERNGSCFLYTFLITGEVKGESQRLRFNLVGQEFESKQEKRKKEIRKKKKRLEKKKK